MVLPGLPRIETVEPLRMTFRCPTHGPVDAILQWHPVGESPRIRASCERCGRYIQWAPMTPANILRADVDCVTLVDDRGYQARTLHDAETVEVVLRAAEAEA